MTLRAYTKTITKSEFIFELEKHQAADAFLRGTYEEDSQNAVSFKGCAVGCSLHSVAQIKGIDLNYGDHAEYENHLGIPEWLARVEDAIFEGIGPDRAKTWPVEFARAVPEGADLEKVKAPFIIKLLERNLRSMSACNFDAEAYPDVAKALEGSKAVTLKMIFLWKEDQTGSAESAARAAESAAWAAAWAARTAAWAARTAESAAWAAESAARSAAAVSAFEEIADDLLEILVNADQSKESK